MFSNIIYEDKEALNKLFSHHDDKLLRKLKSSKNKKKLREKMYTFKLTKLL